MFSVMHDPWIPVLWQNGNKSLVGIRDCLVHADEIKSIQDVSRLNILNYTIHSFLIDMAQDMFQPHDIDDILDLFDKGKFGTKKIDAYINMCEASGVSFDMFDSERPFMQCPKDQLEKYGVMSKDNKEMSLWHNNYIRIGNSDRYITDGFHEQHIQSDNLKYLLDYIGGYNWQEYHLKQVKSSKKREKKKSFENTELAAEGTQTESRKSVLHMIWNTICKFMRFLWQ